MAKRYHNSKNRFDINSTQPHIEDWDSKEIGIPERDLGDSRRGLDENRRGNSAKKTNINPRGV